MQLKIKMERFLFVGVFLFVLGSLAVESGPPINTAGSKRWLRSIGPQQVLLTSVSSGDHNPGKRNADSSEVIKTPVDHSDHHDDTGMFPLNMTTPLRCGEVLNSSSGLIFYKAFESVLEHERCVWTIVDNEAVEYNVNVQYLGQNSDPILNRLTFTGFSKGGNVTQTFTPTKNGEFTISPANILVVVFHTGAIPAGKNDTGFALQYSSVSHFLGHHYRAHGIHQLFSIGSAHYISSVPTFNLEHPIQGHYKTPYTPNELTSFVFVPKNNIYSPERKTTLVYKKDSLEQNNCADHLDVYFFRAITNSWNLKGRLCGDANLELIRNNDITLIIFESDASNEGNGFQFICM